MTSGTVKYALIIAPNHEMYAVPPGWRVFAVDLASGGTYEMHGGFATEAGAIACRDEVIENGFCPADDPGLFCRIDIDARLAAFTPDPDHGR